MNPYKSFKVDKEILDMAEKAEQDIKKVCKRIVKIREQNQLKVIAAMQRNRLSESHFINTTGYGYNDRGRDTLDKIYADVFRAEDAFVRQQIANGTHAIAAAVAGNVMPCDEILCITGKPYDTLHELFGITGNKKGNLKEIGVKTKCIGFCENDKINYEKIKESINKKTKMIYLQRSRGYEWRKALDINTIEKISKSVKRIKKDLIVMVDNCYGEFTEEREPIEAGADIIAGSLIKNPGGGLAECGGYIAGKKEYVNNAADRMIVPGLGREVGCSIGNPRLMFQGLYFAPHVVSESLKGAVFCSAVMERLGFDTMPKTNDSRSDITQAVRFEKKEHLIAFCQGIQAGSPVDSFVTPVPWDMPGYDSPVIMAAGAFIQGSSIELSADAPIKKPYTAYMQGGLVFENVKLGILIALTKMKNSGII